MDVNIQLIIVAICLGIGYLYTKLPIRIVAVESPEVSQPQRQWPPGTDRVADHGNALRVFHAYMTTYVGKTDLLGTLEREQYFQESLRNNPNLTWGELAITAQREAKPVS